MTLNDLRKMTAPDQSTEKMPVLFLGHGSPMNAIEENEFVAGFRRIGRETPKPSAVLCVSAHWETRGTFVTAMERPRTIHDFGGFPKALYEVQYPASGDPALAAETKNLVKGKEVGLNNSWGLDHGAWSVIRHLYPDADIPVIQMSLDYNMSPQDHYDLAKEISPLRRRGVLIVGSGNIVHNLSLVAWDKLDSVDYGYDWAIEAREKLNGLIFTDNHPALINYNRLGRSVQLSIPTPEHYLPLLYVLALKERGENITLFNDKPVAGSLTMTSLKID